MWKVSSKPWRSLTTNRQRVSNQGQCYRPWSLINDQNCRNASSRKVRCSIIPPSFENRVSPSSNFCSRGVTKDLPNNDCNRTFSTAMLSNESSNTIPFILADIGEGIAEVELLQWFVQEGDQVQQFDRICEVQSDKATVEITSRYDGRIATLEHAQGEMVKVGSPLLFLESEEDVTPNLHTASKRLEPLECDEQLHITTSASQDKLASDPAEGGSSILPSSDDTEASSGAFSSSAKVLTTPAIRKLGKEFHLDLSTIVGTGPKGRLLKGDVLTVLRERGLMQPTSKSSAAPSDAAPVPFTTKSSLAMKTITSIDQIDFPLQLDTTLEMRGYNRLMVQSMTASLQIPHMVYADEINVTSLRTQYKSDLPFLPYCVKAASMALLKYPLLNSSFDGEANQVTLWADHNIGIAMDTPRGLIVPVIKQVQLKSMTEITMELQRLKECAKDGLLPAEDLQGATFTLSNIGAIGGGGTYMSPIITTPQVAIGALGQIQRVPRFANEHSLDVYEAHIVNVSWGGDHRVVDGATMARFHTQWKAYLQAPIGLIHEMK